MDIPYPWPLFSSYPPPKVYLPVEKICKMTAFEEGTGKCLFFFLCFVSCSSKKGSLSFSGDPLLEFLEGSDPVSADRRVVSFLTTIPFDN